MGTDFLVYVVDDNNVMQTLFRAMLENQCEVEVFGDAQACLARLGKRIPDLFLLDVGMPGMNGYELCRHLRADERTRDIPVTFISGHGEESDLLAGYEAGGDDYIVKPVKKNELLQKLKVAQRLRTEKETLRNQANDSEMLASLVMSNMDEYAVIIQFIRRATEATNAEQIAEAALACLRGLKLSGVVQVRLDGHITTLGPEGPSRPLEISVINNVVGMGRMFEFKNRAVFNFPAISLMVNDMPVNDSDLCGRLRDHLATAAEIAHARLEAIQAMEENRRKQAGAHHSLQHIGQIVAMLDQREQYARTQATTIIFQLQEDLARTFITIGLTEQQEDAVDQIVQSRIDQLIQLYAEGKSTQKMLADLGEDLKQLAL